MSPQLLAMLVAQQTVLRRKGGESSLSQIAVNEPGTVVFPVRVELETLTMYRGSKPVSNSRAIGNGAVSNSTVQKTAKGKTVLWRPGG